MNRINKLTRQSFYKSGSALKEGTPWPFVNQAVMRERVLLKQLLFFWRYPWHGLCAKQRDLRTTRKRKETWNDWIAKLRKRKRRVKMERGRSTHHLWPSKQAELLFFFFLGNKNKENSFSWKIKSRTRTCFLSPVKINMSK